MKQKSSLTEAPVNAWERKWSCQIENWWVLTHRNPPTPHPPLHDLAPLFAVTTGLHLAWLSGNHRGQSLVPQTRLVRPEEGDRLLGPSFPGPKHNPHFTDSSSQPTHRFRGALPHWLFIHIIRNRVMSTAHSCKSFPKNPPEFLRACLAINDF